MRFFAGCATDFTISASVSRVVIGLAFIIVLQQLKMNAILRRRPPASIRSAVEEAALMPQRQGPHSLHVPGPSPVPERVLRALDRQVIDPRGPEFQRLGHAVLEGCKAIFKTS